MPTVALAAALTLYAAWVGAVFAASSSTPVGTRIAHFLYGQKFADVNASIWPQVLRAHTICVVAFVVLLLGLGRLTG